MTSPTRSLVPRNPDSKQCLNKQHKRVIITCRAEIRYSDCPTGLFRQATTFTMPISPEFLGISLPAMYASLGGEFLRKRNHRDRQCLALRQAHSVGPRSTCHATPQVPRTSELKLAGGTV